MFFLSYVRLLEDTGGSFPFNRYYFIMFIAKIPPIHRSFSFLPPRHVLGCKSIRQQIYRRELAPQASRRVFATEIQHGLANNPILYNIKYPINGPKKCGTPLLNHGFVSAVFNMNRGRDYIWPCPGKSYEIMFKAPFRWGFILNFGSVTVTRIKPPMWYQQKQHMQRLYCEGPRRPSAYRWNMLLTPRNGRASGPYKSNLRYPILLFAAALWILVNTLW